MASTTNLKFFKVSSMPTSLTVGGIYFNDSDSTIRVATSTTTSKIYAGIKDASVVDQVLTLTKSDGSTVKFDMSGAASASAVATALEGKVDKVEGKSLVSDSEITKLGTIASGAQVNKIETIKVNGTALTPDSSKAVNITTANTTYEIKGGTNKITVTPSTGDAYDVTITPSIANNVLKTGTLVNNHVAVFDGTSGVIKDGGHAIATSVSVSGDGLVTEKAVADYVSDKLSSALNIKGTIGTSGDVTALPTTNVKVGDAYVVKTAGTYTSLVCEAGDIIIATATTPTWTVVQNNLDVATSSALGTIKIGYTENSKNYAVKLDASNKAYVSVPWTNTTYTSGDGISITGTTISNSGVKSIASGSTNGTISVDGTNVAVKGLGSAAYANTSSFATSTQGGKADTAVQSISWSDASLKNALSLEFTKTNTSVAVTGAVAIMTGATSSTAGTAGLVPESKAGDQAKFLKADGTWAVPANTNTTYSFANGTAGNFTVTPSGGSAQTVSIGKPATAGTADKVGNSLSITVGSASAVAFDGSGAKSVSITTSTIGAATAAQGTKADTALQTITSDSLSVGTKSNGSVSVDLVWEEFI